PRPARALPPLRARPVPRGGPVLRRRLRRRWAQPAIVAGPARASRVQPRIVRSRVVPGLSRTAVDRPHRADVREHRRRPRLSAGLVVMAVRCVRDRGSTNPAMIVGLIALALAVARLGALAYVAVYVGNLHPRFSFSTHALAVLVSGAIVVETASPAADA